MFEKALVAVDVNSELSLLECAPDLANWGVQHLTLLHLTRTGYGEAPLPGLADDNRERLETAATELRSAGFDVDIVVENVSDIGDALVGFAADYDLVFMGTRSMNLVEEFFLGSTIRTVMRETTVPILLRWVDVDAESDGEFECEEMLRRVVLATDLTHGSAVAHDAAIALASRGATIDCVHVMSGDELSHFEDPESMVGSVLDGIVAQVADAGGDGEAFIEHGSPVPALLSHIERRDASMLIVGRSGRNWPRNLVGSTARTLCERTRLPVLLVPRPVE